MNLEDLIFIVTFKPEITFKNYIYLLTNTEGEITDISSGILTYFPNMDSQTIKK